MGDNANYYQNIAGVEAIDILNDVVKDLPGKQAAMLWNTLKYLLRFQKKNGVEDLKKAQNYLQRLIDETGEVKDLTGKDSEMLWDTWHSKKYGDIRIFSRSSNPNGMPSKLTFDLRSAAVKFKKIFSSMISDGWDAFSIAGITLEMGFEVPKYNKWDYLVNWKNMLDSFSTEIINGRYELIFNYKDSSSETSESFVSEHNPYISYVSRASGTAEVCYSTHMCTGTCTMIRFTNETSMYLFAGSFFNKLTYPCCKAYSIRDVLEDAHYILPSTADDFCIDIPWRDFFEKFRMFKEDGKYILEFIYKKEEK